MPHRHGVVFGPRGAGPQAPGVVQVAGLVDEDLDFPFAACLNDPGGVLVVIHVLLGLKLGW